jgi:hypothetical protein
MSGRTSLENALRSIIEYRQGDQVDVRGCAGTDPKCSGDSLALRIRQALDISHHRSQKLVQAGERHVGLRWNADRREKRQTLSNGHGTSLGNERRLPDTGITTNEKRGTALVDLLDESSQLGKLALPSKQCKAHVAHLFV